MIYVHVITKLILSSAYSTVVPKLQCMPHSHGVNVRLEMECAKEFFRSTTLETQKQTKIQKQSSKNLMITWLVHI